MPKIIFQLSSVAQSCLTLCDPMNCSTPSLQARLQQCVNHEIPDVQVGFRKGRGTEIKLPTSTESSKKQEREFQKNIYFCFIDYVKVFDSVDHNNL